jgi:hypothetical protein
MSSETSNVELGAATRLSSTEFAVCATILGAPSFPTVGSELLASRPGAVLRATLEAVTSSFVARGLVEAGDDGFATLCDPLRELVEVAVFPDLTISVEGLGAGGAKHWWFGLRPDRCVQVSVLPDGSRECTQIEPSRVIDRIVAVSETGSMRVSTAWRDGEVIRGGAFTWEPAVDTDGLRLELLDHLPGSAT